MRETAQTFGFEVLDIFAAAFALTRARWTDETDTIRFDIGNPPRWSRIQVQLADDATVSELLEEISASQTRAIRSTESPPEEGSNRSWTPTSLVVFDGSAKGTRRIDLDGRDGITIHRVGDRWELIAVSTLAPAFSVLTHWLACLEEAILQITRDPLASLRSIDIIPPDVRRRLIVEWNDTARPIPNATLLHDLFDRRADECPEQVAVEGPEGRLEYGELRRRANRLAHLLRARGAKAGTFVAVCLPRGFDLITTLLAVSKSGAAYIPIDSHEPDDRAHLVLRSSQASIVVCTRERASFDLPMLVLDDVLGTKLEDSEALATIDPLPSSSTTDPCYAIHTSGSTGTPKGVVMTHRAVVNTLDWVSRTFAVGRCDRALFINSPSFDLSVYDVFGVLGAGATIVLADAETTADPELLGAYLLDRRITLWNSAPAALERILPSIAPHPSGDLRLVLISGDWVRPHLVERVRMRFPTAHFVALGGATEAAIWSNAFSVDAIDPAWTSIPYGRPIQNARYYILDHRQSLVPIGAPGDLYIGGTCLAEGYLHRPDLTDERFLPDPFIPGERVYRTGDRARYFADGNIEFLGRRDHQVKIRGYRVELGEVETTLVSHTAVREAVCITELDPSDQQRLVAHLAVDHPADFDESNLRAHLKRSLPAYMIPSRFVAHDRLPLTPQGKIDRRRLPASANPPSTVSRAATPVSRLEAEVQSIWGDLLGIENVGLDDDFFELGGHSLLAIVMVSRLKSELDLDIPASRLLECRTIASLLAADLRTNVIRHLQVVHADGHRPALVMVAGIGGYALTYRDFAALLPTDQPVFALRSPGAEIGESLNYHSVEEIAEIYERELEAVCPRGPVILSGFSFGALPAFELARRLERRGRQVPLLISFDGYAPNYPATAPWQRRFQLHASALLHGATAERRAYLRERAANVYGRWARRVRLARGALEHRLSPMGPGRIGRHLERLRFLRRQAISAYKPTSGVQSKMLLVRVEQPLEWLGVERNDPLYGWEDFVEDVDLVTVPCGHAELFCTIEQRRIAEAITHRIDAVIRDTRIENT